MSREIEEQESKRIGEQPPPGAWRDGELVTIEPGQPIPQPKIIMPDGSIVTPEELAEIEAIEDDAELRSAYEATGEVDDDED